MSADNSHYDKLAELLRLALTDWAIANISVRHRKQGQAEAALSSLGDVLGELAARIEMPHTAEPTP